MKLELGPILHAAALETSGSIYALVDDRVPDLVRYVGQTVQPLQLRLLQHLSCALSGGCRTPRSQWIRAVYADGSQIGIRLIESHCQLHELDWRERDWIRAFPEGQLVNSGRGGRSSSRRQLDRQAIFAALGK